MIVPDNPLILLTPKEPNSMFLSSTVRVVALMVVVAPFTVKLPPTTRSLPTVTVLPPPAEEEPRFILDIPVVAFVPKFTVMLLVVPPKTFREVAPPVLVLDPMLITFAPVVLLFVPMLIV